MTATNDVHVQCRDCGADWMEPMEKAWFARCSCGGFADGPTQPGAIEGARRKNREPVDRCGHCGQPKNDHTMSQCRPEEML